MILAISSNINRYDVVELLRYHQPHRVLLY